MAEQSQTARGHRLRHCLVPPGDAFALNLLALVLLLTMPACGRGSSPPMGPSVDLRWCAGTSLGTMQATIDGITWTSVRVAANSFGNALELVASDCTYKFFMFLEPVTGPGTYTVPGGGISIASLTFDGRGPETWTANPTQGGSGSVTLTAFTKPTTVENLAQTRVSGTFSFILIPINATGTKVITDGSFESGFASFAP